MKKLIKKIKMEYGKKIRNNFEKYFKNQIEKINFQLNYSQD